MEVQSFSAKSSSKIFLSMAILGGLGCIATFFSGSNEHGHTAYWYSYLIAVVFFLSLSLGGLFFVLIQHLTRAAWSVTVRRIAENVAGTLNWFWVLIIPVAVIGGPDIFSWMHADVVAGDKILQAKAGYLNATFFYVRLAAYILVWVLLTRSLLKKSVAQDTSGDKNITKSLAKMSTYGLILYALTETFFAFDFMMSLNPHWFSTMFGVYYFSCSAVGIMALLIIIAAVLQKKGYVKSDVINTEHYHDLGKLLFGFNVFWTYIAFSQWMLIWYANLGEETDFFLLRTIGDWKTLSIVIPILHFAIPFLFLMSREVKRNIKALTFMSVWLLVISYVDIYWLIMPNINISHGGHGYGQVGVHFGLTDISSLLLAGGFFFYLLVKNMEKSSLVPLKDPRLSECLKYENG